MHEEPHHRRILHEQLLHPDVQLAAGLVVDGDLGFLIQILKRGAIVAEVVFGIGVVRDVPGLGVTDDGEVVVRFLPDPRQPLPPLGLLNLDLDPDLLELARNHLARAHRIVVLWPP